MAKLRFRDRFFSPPVARALTSPSGILALGAGAAVGIVATASFSVPLAVFGGVAGGAIGLGGRLAAALPKQKAGPRIDPFEVDEPWRHAVLDAVRAEVRFSEAIKTFRSGPLQDQLRQIDARIDEAVDECWRIAQQGHLIAAARDDIDEDAVRRELQRVQAQGAERETPSEATAKTIEALEAQLAVADRMDQLLRRTADELQLLNARLDQTVTQAIELSVSNRTSDAGPLGATVVDIVDDLTSLRQAMDALDAGAAPSSPNESATSS